MSIKSSSNVIGVTDAVLTLKFTPITELPPKGTISLRIPHWYLAASTAQGADYDEKLGTVLDYDSVATLKSSQSLTIDTQFDQLSQIYSINYETSENWLSEIEIDITNFKNPINRNQLLGFQVMTSDSNNFIIDKTYGDLALETDVTVT